MHDPDLVDPRFGSGQVQRLHHVDGLHRRPEHPGDDVARVVIQHRREVVPAPAHDLQVGEVRSATARSADASGCRNVFAAESTM